MTVEKAALFMPDSMPDAKMQKTTSFLSPLATYVRTRVKKSTESVKKVSASDPTNLAETQSMLDVPGKTSQV
jgi:hypothetical protein